jgi:hypothetical protein
MNSIAPLPPSTSLTDVVALVVFSLFMAGVLHLFRGQKLRLSEEVAVVCKRRSIPDCGQAGLPEDMLPAVREFHWSMAAFMLTWLPLVVLVTGFTCCSLLRDAGYLIFPWPLLTISVVSGLTLWVAQRIRLRAISRRLLRGPNQHLQATPR